MQFIAGTDNKVRRLEAAHRFEKDILKVGSWRVGDETWNVTPETLRRLKTNFDQAKANGCDCPVVFNHSNDVRDRTGKVDDLIVRGDVLVSQFTLSNPSAESTVVNSGGVSVEVFEPWHDGAGNEYDVMLTHLGIVNHPVIPDQGPFKRLSLQGNQSMSKPRFAVRQLANGQSFVRRLAEGDVVAPDETATDSPPAEVVAASEVPSLDQAQFDAISPVVMQLLEDCYGVKLPDGTTPENFIANVTNTVSIASQMTASEPEEAPAEEAAPMEDASVALSLKGGSKREKQLALELQQMKDEQAKQKQLAIRQAEVNYRAKLDQLCAETKVLAASRESLIENGKATQWSMSLLEPYESLAPQLNTSSKTRQFAGTPKGAQRQLSHSEAREAGLRAAGLSTKSFAKK